MLYFTKSKMIENPLLRQYCISDWLLMMQHREERIRKRSDGDERMGEASRPEVYSYTENLTVGYRGDAARPCGGDREPRF